MNSMVGDVLNTAAIEAGALSLQLERCDAHALVEEAVDLFASMAPEHRIEIAGDPGPLWIHCDHVRVAQVLNNLLANAIKYSRKGSVVRVALASKEARVAFAVSDEGAGLGPEEREHIFELFHHEGVLSELVPGVGLGLYISRKIAEAHGGSLTAESVVGAGAIFTLTLPLLPEAH
jgi:signal transduction histidine kinase